MLPHEANPASGGSWTWQAHTHCPFAQTRWFSGVGQILQTSGLAARQSRSCSQSSSDLDRSPHAAHASQVTASTVPRALIHCDLCSLDVTHSTQREPDVRARTMKKWGTEAVLSQFLEKRCADAVRHCRRSTRRQKQHHPVQRFHTSTLEKPSRRSRDESPGSARV